MLKAVQLCLTLLCITCVASIYGQDWAKARLEESPRHGEWVEIEQGDRKLQAFLVFPEIKDKATAVIVIHEIFGLTDWVRGVADQLAEAGYIAIAPDLLSGMGKDGGGTSSFGGEEVRRAIAGLSLEQITADLNAALKYVEELPACNGKVVVTGFCWGGTQTFNFATNNSKILAAFPFYGTAPREADAIARIECPVYAFYAENDARVNATIDDTKRQMQEHEKKFDSVMYDQAGHGFMRAGEAPDANTANKLAREAAWARLKEILSGLND
ncbi:MAG TPA: dienelactone hydrolase family protein [Pirellulaceae bacterium]|nr:dienelactone hydrolase family protein [Pirellulaceae bacterium]HMP67815.1 dienelactone hydrolase family protein [Pirellulaceae bacterium]